MNRYKMILSYDGTDYSGWQIQPHKPTIQEALQRALKQITNETVIVIGSGRTDAGVHALGQTAHFSLNLSFNPNLLLEALNDSLPSTIRIRSLVKKESPFHARFDAIKKTYTYSLHLSPHANPFTHRYQTRVSSPFDPLKFKKALSHFRGKRNFTSFANRANTGSAAQNPIKTLERVSCMEKEGDLMIVTFEGDGFLYKMVRNLMGTALAVAKGALPLKAIEEIFLAKNRRLAPPPAPPQGLCLQEVTYTQTNF